jgi:hypothetical protein
MRKLIVLFLCCLGACTSIAKKNTPASFDTVSEIQILRDSLTLLSRRVIQLEQDINDSQLEISIKTAEGIITKQNNLISGFEVLYGVISLLIVVVSLLIYIFNVRPLIGNCDTVVARSERAVDTLNTRMDNFDQMINAKLEQNSSVFEKKIKEERIDQVFKDLLGNYPYQRRLALEVISTLPSEGINFERISTLFDFLNQKETTETEKIAIVEVLTQINSKEVQSFFTYWTNVKSTEYQLKQSLIRFYTANDFTKYLIPVSNFIHSTITPHLEFKTLSGYLSSFKPKGIVELANFPQLVNRLDRFNKREICTFLNSHKDSWKLKSEIENCLLCKEV